MDMLEDDDWMIATRINRVSIEDMQSNSKDLFTSCTEQ